MLAEGKTLTSSFLIKKAAREAKGGVAFVRVGSGKRLEYIFLPKPKNFLKNLDN